MVNTNHRNKQEVVETLRGRNGTIYKFIVLTKTGTLLAMGLEDGGTSTRDYGCLKGYFSTSNSEILTRALHKCMTASNIAFILLK